MSEDYAKMWPQCQRCKHVRPQTELSEASVCKDQEWCWKQAVAKAVREQGLEIKP